MSRERFDFVFALGSGCACSRMLRERGLQFASFPLDWVGGISFAVGAGGALRQTAGLIVSRRDGKEMLYKAADSELASELHHIIERIAEISCPV